MKNILTSNTKYPIIALLICTSSCVEEFVPKTEVRAETQQLASALVVDGLLTDEVKRHQVMLTRAFGFEEEMPQAETGATVRVIDGQGTEIMFLETEPGVYLSQNDFAAESGETYTLRITTSDGSEYSSDAVRTPQRIDIGELRAERITNDLEVEGVGIFLDNEVDTSEPTYFRYEYEETYKIIAPRWDPFRMIVVRYEPCFPDPFVVDIEPWEDERRVCFNSDLSKSIIQTSTTGLNDREVDNFQVRFIDRSNYIMSHRYSILVTQYSQTQDAFSFYERLEDFSSSENIFSQIQPGLLEGNINSTSNSDLAVLGYFEVASVSKQRVYFNYADLFPGVPLPPYAINCENFGNPRLWPEGYHCDGLGVCDGNCDSPLIEAIIADLITFAGETEDFFSPYFTWPSPCGDCTKLGSNVVPEFWEE